MRKLVYCSLFLLLTLSLLTACSVPKSSEPANEKNDKIRISNLSENTLKNLIKDIYVKYGYEENLITEIEIEKNEPFTISSVTKENGYLVKAYIMADNPEHLFFQDVLAIFNERLISPNQKEYELLFENMDIGITYELIDIETDGGKEIVLINGGGGSFAAEANCTDLKIYKYMDGQYLCIFDEGLRYRGKIQIKNEQNEEIPVFYNYENNYKLEKNEQNPAYFDIIFNINTFWENVPENTAKITREPVKEEVRFIFDGKKYVPNRDFYKYKAPIPQ